MTLQNVHKLSARAQKILKFIFQYELLRSPLKKNMHRGVEADVNFKICSCNKQTFEEFW